MRIVNEWFLDWWLTLGPWLRCGVAPLLLALGVAACFALDEAIKRDSSGWFAGGLDRCHDRSRLVGSMPPMGSRSLRVLLGVMHEGTIEEIHG